MNCIFVGRLDELKGIKMLFNMWKEDETEEHRLKVYGDGPLREWCNEFITNNKVGNIELMGHLENGVVKEAIAKSDVLIVPSIWYEGFPMVIVEAYSVGTPVIGSDIGNISYLIEDGITGYKFGLNDYNGLRMCLEKIEKIPLDRNKIIEVSKKYSPSNNYIELVKIYGSIAN